jgi:hypothetical protein
VQIDQASKQTSKQQRETAAADATNNKQVLQRQMVIVTTGTKQTINQSDLIELGDIIETIIQQQISEHSEIFPRPKHPSSINVINFFLHWLS